MRDSDYEVNMTLFVSVEDVSDEKPELKAGHVTWILEEMTVGTVVYGLFSMIDADVSDQHVYKILGKYDMATNYIGNMTCLQTTLEIRHLYKIQWLQAIL